MPASASAASPPLQPSIDPVDLARYFWRESVLSAIDRHGAEVARDYAAAFRADFFAWLQWVNIEDPKALDPSQRSRPFILWPKQRELAQFLLDAYRAGRKPLVNKSREIGATWLATAILYWLWLVEPTFSAAIMSRKEDLVDNWTTSSIFGKLRLVHSCMPAFLKPKVEDHFALFVNTANGSYIKGESTNAEGLRSGRYGVVLCDEWAFVEPRKQSRIRMGMESVPRSWWRISTPNGENEDFHSAWDKAQPQDKLEIGWRADPRRTDAWFEGLLAENGGDKTWDEREQEYNCSFKGVSGLRILKADEARMLYTDADLPPRARELLPMFAAMDFGSGPSWTVCLFFLVDWELLADGRYKAHIWLDRELYWQRRSAGEIGLEIMEAKQEYGSAGHFFGDPAGRNVESDQESWESNLNAAGVPIVCLPGDTAGGYNQPTMIDETLRDVQRVLDSGDLRVHERCRLARKSIERWEYDVPTGISLELVNRGVLKPKKNAWSHFGDALRYGVGAIVRMNPAEARDTAEIAAALPKSAGGEIMELWDRLLGPGGY